MSGAKARAGPFPGRISDAFVATGVSKVLNDDACLTALIELSLIQTVNRQAQGTEMLYRRRLVSAGLP
jgi:hypothetical protein